MIYENIIRILKEKGVAFVVHEHEPVFTMIDVQEKLSFPIENLLKTIVFKIRDSNWVLAVVKGTDKIDYRKLATILQVPRANLLRPSITEVESELHLQVGGICPISPNENIESVYDDSVLDMDLVYCGVGRNDRTLEINIKDLLSVSNARIGSITKELD